jgi:hypothetical protein
MDPSALRDTLAKLHEELGRSTTLDPQSRQLLGQIMADIARLTDDPAAAKPGAASGSQRSRLEGIAVQFEVDHPSLAASIRRMTDLLANAGL